MHINRNGANAMHFDSIGYILNTDIINNINTYDKAIITKINEIVTSSKGDINYLDIIKYRNALNLEYNKRFLYIVNLKPSFLKNFNLQNEKKNIKELFNKIFDIIINNKLIIEKESLFTFKYDNIGYYEYERYDGYIAIQSKNESYDIKLILDELDKYLDNINIFNDENIIDNYILYILTKTNTDTYKNVIIDIFNVITKYFNNIITYINKCKTEYLYNIQNLVYYYYYKVVITLASYYYTAIIVNDFIIDGTNDFKLFLISKYKKYYNISDRDLLNEVLSEYVLLKKIIVYYFYYSILNIKDINNMNKINLYKITFSDIHDINSFIDKLITILTNKNVVYYITIDENTPSIKKILINYINKIVHIYTSINNKKTIKLPITTTTTGGNKGYKSTHKKVNIMNNEKVIERVIYIDNDKNKFIKLNKNYFQLSTFKYNKK
jgi:hypothetical protein